MSTMMYLSLLVAYLTSCHVTIVTGLTVGDMLLITSVSWSKRRGSLGSSSLPAVASGLLMSFHAWKFSSWIIFWRSSSGLSMAKCNPRRGFGQSVDESYDVWCMRNCLFAEEATEIDIT